MRYTYIYQLPSIRILFMRIFFARTECSRAIRARAKETGCSQLWVFIHYYYYSPLAMRWVWRHPRRAFPPKARGPSIQQSKSRKIFSFFYGPLHRFWPNLLLFLYAPSSYLSDVSASRNFIHRNLKLLFFFCSRRRRAAPLFCFFFFGKSCLLRAYLYYDENDRTRAGRFIAGAARSGLFY